MSDDLASTPPDIESTSGVAVLDRAFALLAAFGPNDDRLTLTELSRRTDLYKSTVLRLLAALEHGGFVRKLPEGQYSIGPQPSRLAAIYQRSFRVGHVIEPLLEQLSRNCGETASFYVRHGDTRVVLFRVEPPRAVRFSVRIGEAFAINQGASGKVLLAFSEPRSPEHQAWRDQVWAVSYGEREPEIASAAVPVLAVNGQLQGALALSGPMARLAPPDILLTACRQLLEAARSATLTLGGDGEMYARSLEQLNADALARVA